jgi:hypothetical protein
MSASNKVITASLAKTGCELATAREHDSVARQHMKGDNQGVAAGL